MSTEDDGTWVPFSEAYGIHGQEEIGRWQIELGGTLADHAWRWRHDGSTSEFDERDERFRCRCPGSMGIPGCVQRATQEDRQCDACRRWCWGQTEDGKRVAFIDAYGPHVGPVAEP